MIDLSAVSRELRRPLGRALEGHPVGPEDALALFHTTGTDRAALLATADAVRRTRAGNRVHFVVVRNINFTNVCNVGCRFCAFSKSIDAPEAEHLTPDEVALKAEEAWNRGATEVCLQGGLHPEIDGSHYRDLVVAIRARVPDIHIHAFSPFEIKYGAGKSNRAIRDHLKMLVEAGLNSMPGTAAEILDRDIRQQLTRNKLSADEWVHIIRTAHEMGIRTSSTMMYGHIDGPRHWVEHMALLRQIQEETGGFTEFVPLGFVPWNTPLFQDGNARPGPTLREHEAVHAVARLMLQGAIDHIQVSWVKLGRQNAQRMLNCGADDFGGTLMNESISRAAGSTAGQEMTAGEFCQLIRDIDRVPAQRNTFYETLAVFDSRRPKQESPCASSPVL